MDNLRRFILVFTAVIFLTLAICGFVLAKNYNETAKTEEVNLGVNTNIFDPNRPNETDLSVFNENILLVIGDKDGKASELTVLVNVNTETNELSFLYFPREFKYATIADRDVGIMGMLCNKKGISKAADVIASQYEITVDNYIYMPSSVFAEFIDAFAVDPNLPIDPNPTPAPDGGQVIKNGVEYSLYVDLKYVSGKYNIDLSRDTKVFTGSEALQLIQFYRTQNNEYSTEMLKYYDGTDSKRISAAQSFLHAFITQKLLKTGNAAFADEFASKTFALLAKCESNLTEQNLKQIGTLFTKINSDAIRYFKINGSDIYLDQHYIVYNETINDLASNSMLDGATVLKENFFTN